MLYVSSQFILSLRAQLPYYLLDRLKGVEPNKLRWFRRVLFVVVSSIKWYSLIVPNLHVPLLILVSFFWRLLFRLETI